MVKFSVYFNRLVFVLKPKAPKETLKPSKPVHRGDFSGGHSGSKRGGKPFPSFKRASHPKKNWWPLSTALSSTKPSGWRTITNDQWVLSIVRQGYRIPFQRKPPLSPTPIFFQQSPRPELEEEVIKLIQKGAVERINPEVPGYHSRIFLVPKKNGKLRLIIDLSKLNSFLKIQSFSVETVNKVRQAIHPIDWAFSLDLTDAYLHVAIHKASRMYLRFCLRDKVFQFRALPFGLATSLFFFFFFFFFLFTHLMVAIAAHLQKLSNVLFRYLDDWLVRNQDRLALLRDKDTILHLIVDLGLIINVEKSDLTPFQSFTFIGIEFLTRDNIVSPVGQNSGYSGFRHMVPESTFSLSQRFPFSLRETQCSSSIYCPGQTAPSISSDGTFRPVETSCFATRPQSSDHRANQISSGVVEKHRSVPLRSPSQTTSTFTYPVHGRQCVGLGRSLGTRGTSVSWSLGSRPITTPYQHPWDEDDSSRPRSSPDYSQQYHCHDYYRQCFSGVVHSQTRGNPRSIPMYGSVGNPNMVSSEEQNSSCETHSGQIQYQADRLSRILKPIQTEWSLYQSVASLIFLMIGHPNIDLFATRLNNRLPLYVSPIPDNRALAIDALSMNWDHIHGYAFPPFHILPAVLNEIRQHPCRIVLVAPLWPQRSWFPELLQLLIPPPIKLPLVPDLLSQLRGKFIHQNPQMLALHVWELSSNQLEIKEFSAEVAEDVSAARRASTRKVYDTKWSVFSHWCHSRKVNPISASPRIVADFLRFLFKENNLQVSTIKGYRAMISDTLKFISGASVGSDPIISELMRSFEIQKPAHRFLAPKWDLSYALSSLCTDSFAPLHKAFLLHLTMKTAFLLAMATAKRVSEIHALAMDSEHLRFNKLYGSVSLRTQSGFLTKNQLPSKCPESILVPNLA